MRRVERLAVFAALLAGGLGARAAAAHPAWGIAVDPRGRVVFSEVETNTVWRIENGRPAALLRGKHSHEIYMDGAGNLYGEHLRYEPAGERWILSLWKLTPEGKEVEVLPPTDMADVPKGLGPLRDRRGNTWAFWGAFERGGRMVLYRRTPRGEAAAIAGGPAGHADGRGAAARFTGTPGKAFGPDGSLYVTDGPAVRRITPDGRVTTLGGYPLAGVPHGERPRLFGLAVDERGRVLVADFDHRAVREIAPDGRVRERWRSGPRWSPTGVAVAGGALYVLETRPEALSLLGRSGPYARVQRVAPDGSAAVLATLGERSRAARGVSTCQSFASRLSGGGKPFCIGCLLMCAARLAKLGIHLQDGFTGDEVVVKINGVERLHRYKVHTKRVLGLAERAELEVDDGPLAIEVSVPTRGLEKRVELEASGEVHLGVSLGGGEVRVITRKTPFGYG